MTDRCRLCTTNDRQALIDHVAGDMWRRCGVSPWTEASPSWQREFCLLATYAVEAMELHQT